MQMKNVFNNNLKNSFSALHTPSKNVLQAPKFPKVNSVKTEFVAYNSLDRKAKNTLRGELITKLYQINQNVKNHTDFFITLEHDEDQYWIEFHRKFALTYAIIVLFFVGAPLGAIVKKGGFGLPVVISAVLFMIYFIVLSIGENLADTYVISPFWGMWLPSIFFTPLAIIITFAANRDLSIFQNINPLPRWRNAWKRK
jgi:lipopolysaccharide export system permease protein